MIMMNDALQKQFNECRNILQQPSWRLNKNYVCSAWWIWVVVPELWDLKRSNFKRMKSMFKSRSFRHSSCRIDPKINPSIITRVLNRWSWITLEQMHRFSRFGHRGHWQVTHKPSFMCHLSVSPEPELEKLCNCPKVIQLLK